MFPESPIRSANAATAWRCNWHAPAPRCAAVERVPSVAKVVVNRSSARTITVILAPETMRFSVLTC